ncbi:putative Cytochrome c-type biogenesis protein CcmF (modular protein) [Magnetospirillum sp. XM-1]|uniref:cytochrome c biogenesis protein CcsA n=1 Tax=Magnetospirillum sp. XM-1 TaxID=1663591 RepID=UPI00073DC11D|nr:cytochrome c biogenesis protein CcsA [Magnetospirillum sp. XM-1]CUW39594.1 putative Cytochrome c-type biogenesis protein CcmF (modular protein) [Magnetospirillum sp. XM-1]
MSAEAVLPPLAIAALAMAVARHSRPAGYGAVVLLLLAVLGLAARFLADDGGNALVFRHAGGDQPWPLRLAGLWASDQGTLLLMALMLAGMGARWSGGDGWAARGAQALALAFTIGTVLWNPFDATSPEALAGPPPRHNSHLATPWMVIHPPLLLAALALVIAPAGAACQALARPGQTQWSELAGGCVRAAWIILGAGLAAGMWWAYQDFTFGQFWHWDPAQTAIFAVWMALTAQIHTHEAHRRSNGRRFAVLHPLLGLVAAVLALAAMAVIRLPMLASSHRYVGDTSAPLLAGLAVLLAMATALAVWRRPAGRATAPRDALDVAVALMMVAAAVAVLHLGHSLAAALLHLPRPDGLKPFLDMLLRWATPTEAEALRQAFAQWEPDPVAVNLWLLPPATALGLAGGHALLPRFRRPATVAAVLAVVLAIVVDPVTARFDGSGITAAGTVAHLDLIGGLWAAMAYLGLAALARLGTALRQRQARPALAAGLHLGIAVALAALLAATVFDGIAQRIIRWPDQAGALVALPDGQSVGIFPPAAGAPATARAVWRLERDGVETERAEGLVHVRDDTPFPAGQRGSQRMVCEILDYRYARQISGRGHMIDPFIHRGLWRDVQVWLPALDSGASHDLPVVVKTFPLVSWLWGGLALTLLSALAMGFHARRQR